MESWVEGKNEVGDAKVQSHTIYRIEILLTVVTYMLSQSKYS